MCPLVTLCSQTGFWKLGHLLLHDFGHTPRHERVRQLFTFEIRSLTQLCCHYRSYGLQYISAYGKSVLDFVHILGLPTMVEASWTNLGIRLTDMCKAICPPSFSCLNKLWSWCVIILLQKLGQLAMKLGRSVCHMAMHVIRRRSQSISNQFNFLCCAKTTVNVLLNQLST